MREQRCDGRASRSLIAGLLLVVVCNVLIHVLRKLEVLVEAARTRTKDWWQGVCGHRLRRLSPSCGMVVSVMHGSGVASASSSSGEYPSISRPSMLGRPLPQSYDTFTTPWRKAG
jgi:hypothetical protein